MNIIELATAFRHTANNADLADRLMNELAHYGFTSYVYALVPQAPADDMQYLNITNLNDEWMHHYTEQKYFERDYMLDHCLVATTPVRWSAIFASGDKGCLGDGYQPMLEACRDFGVQRGVTIPVRAGYGYDAGISLIADTSTKDKEVDELFGEHKDHILACIDLFHAAIDTGSIAQTYYQLSEKQRTVLRWLAEGHTQAAIAHKLHIHRSGVEKHLKAARDKLVAATATQAVAKAVMLGLI